MRESGQGQPGPEQGALLTADFDYELPPELIAQTPLERRDSSRLLVLDRESGAVTHSAFHDIGAWLCPGDLLIGNNSRVIPARLFGTRPNGGAVELLLLRQEGELWSALARPAKRLKAGDTLEFPATRPETAPAIASVKAHRTQGEILVQFHDDAAQRLADYGHAPLPPYITETLADEERYQTVYNVQPGSAAAPTAGLHFTRELLAKIQADGVGWEEITLHVGLDTFRPVTEKHAHEHVIHREWCQVSQETAEAIASCRRNGGRVIAVGTTVARTLETLGHNWDNSNPRGFDGFTAEFILPGHNWRLVDALVTNFHLPQSTLLMLVSALAGKDAILQAYAEAVRERYRFFSFGDAMLIR